MSTFKKGDRVRYTGKRSALFANDLRVGTFGTVESGSGGLTVVQWDNDKDILAPHYSDNLELITAIDPTKPLWLVGKAGVQFSVINLIAKTDDGSFVVEAPGATADWFIFDAQGKFVRSDGGTGTSLSLVNAPEVVKGKQQISIGPLSVEVDYVVTDGVVTSVTLA